MRFVSPLPGVPEEDFFSEEADDEKSINNRRK